MGCGPRRRDVSVVLSGRRNGSTHREVALLASLPGELRLIGGLAVMFSVLGGGGLFANITSILAVVITAVFIILYGVNLKHMR